MNHQSNQPTTYSCSPILTENTIHHLSSEQLAFLNRGPSYVSPCQMHLLVNSSVSLNEILRQQLAPLQQQFTELFHRYPIDHIRRETFEKYIKQQFMKSFSVPIPLSLKKRALYEKQLIQSIQTQLKREDLIVRRTADDMNTFYLGQRTEFDHVVREYLENSTWYDFIGTIDDHHSEIISSINIQLEKFADHRLITEDQWTKFKIDPQGKFHLPRLYFLPQTSHGGHLSVQPRFSYVNKQSPLQSITTYLEQLLRPLFEKISRSTTCLNGGDFIQQLEGYCRQEDLFTSYTRLVTFEIHNLSIRLSHADILRALTEFLMYPSIYHQHPMMTTNGIIELTKIVLQNNLFTYDNKLYRHRKGAPLHCPLTRLLFNIYLYHWQTPIVRLLHGVEEFFSRYHHQLFFTWDGPLDRLRQLITQLNEQHPDIQLTISIGKKVHFLHASVENKDGHLYTHVYHDPVAQSFLLPYVEKQHPRCIYRQWFRFALIRAGQYCNYVEDFHDERRRIECTFLANGYSFHFVECQRRRFFRQFNVHPYLHDLFDLNISTYITFRRQLFHYLEQYQQTYEREQQLINNQQLIQFHYLFDWGLRCQFNAKFWKFWSEILCQDSTFRQFNLKIRLHAKHCYSSNVLFVPQL